MGPFDHGNTQKTDLYQTSLYCTPQWKWGIKILFVIFQKRYPTWTTCSLAVPVKSWTVSFLIITMHQQEKLLEYKLLEASHNKSSVLLFDKLKDGNRSDERGFTEPVDQSFSSCKLCYFTTTSVSIRFRSDVHWTQTIGSSASSQRYNCAAMVIEWSVQNGFPW